MLWTSRATPQTPQRTDPPARSNTTVAHQQSALPTLRDRADFPSCGVVASSLGAYPTSSAPPCLRGNLPRSRPRGTLRQASKVLTLLALTMPASQVLAAPKPAPEAIALDAQSFEMDLRNNNI